MGLFMEEMKHPTLKRVEITVDSHGKDEIRRANDIVSLSVSAFSVRDVDDLKKLGNWLIKQHKYIKENYSPEGKKIKKVKTNAVKTI